MELLHDAVMGPDAVPALIRGVFHQRADLAECRLVTDPAEEAPGRIVAEAVGAAGKRFRAVAVIRADGNAHAMVVKALPDGLALREAVPADGPRLAELCRRTPIVTGLERTTVDYGDDYLRATALVDRRIVLVIEREGQIVGTHGCVIHDAVFGERRMKLAYLRHTRIDPGEQGLGVFSALNGAVFERGFAAAATAYSLVAVGNDRMLEKLPEELRRWPWQHHRFFVDTRALADTSMPLVEVDPTDAASLINSAHAREAINPATTAEAFRRRLGVASHLYGPNRLRGGTCAVLGVSREPIITTTEGVGLGVTRREAVAYDVGATDVDAFEVVLRSWCHLLAADGIDDLAVDASTASPLYGCLSSLARSIRSYAVQLSVPPPPNANGFWVDSAII